MGRLYFLRHGETDFNAQNLLMGQMNINLNSKGIKQAQIAANRISNLGIEKIYSSPLSRALETSRIILSALEIDEEISVIPELSERCYGILEGMEKSEKLRNSINHPSVERLENFIERVRKGIEKVDTQKTCLIISHSGVFKSLIAALSYSSFPLIKTIGNCEFVELRKTLH